MCQCGTTTIGNKLTQDGHTFNQRKSYARVGLLIILAFSCVLLFFIFDNPSLWVNMNYYPFPKNICCFWHNNLSILLEPLKKHYFVFCLNFF